MVAPKVIINPDTQEVLELKELRPLCLWPIYKDENDNEVPLCPFPNVQGYEVID